MVLWQCKLHASWRAQWVSFLIHGAVSFSVLLAPWPVNYTFIWMTMFSLVVLEGMRSQRRINSQKGEIIFYTEHRLKWQGREWVIVGAPWIVQSGMLLRIYSSDNSRCQRLWLAADSMNVDEWRDLCRLMLQYVA